MSAKELNDETSKASPHLLALQVQDLEAQLRAARALLDEARRSFHETLLEAQETAALKQQTLEARLSAGSLERHQLEATLEGLKTRAQTLEQACLEALLENRCITRELDELEAERQRHLLKIEAVNAELAHVYASASWRFSRPFRALKGIFRRNKVP